MSRRYLSEARDGDINVLNRLFGRDLAAPDPSMIWALRGRTR